MTPSGWKEAGELKVGDRIVEAVPHYLSEQQWEVIRGSLMGDGALSPSKSGFAARFRFGHGVRQTEYADWKGSLFSNLTISRSTNSKNAVFFDLQPISELALLRHDVYVQGKKHFDDDFFKQLTPLSLAIWYMDDASFALRSKGLQVRTEGGSGRIEICVEAMSPDTRDRLVSYLRDVWNIDTRLRASGQMGKAVLVFDRGATDCFQALVAPHVHPSMAYKLLPRYQGQFDVTPQFVGMRYELDSYPIVDIHDKPLGKRTHRFDLEVEDSHNYFADGVMVHNSPEVTPGGRALKFYASVRLEVRRVETIKDGAESVGNRVRVKVTKNKVAPPFRQAEFDIVFGEGISREGSLLDVAVDEGVVKKSGAWFTFDNDQLGQGRENAKRFLRENPEVAMQLQAKVYETVGMNTEPVTAEMAEDANADN
jgi:recombination protein RecA